MEEWHIVHLLSWPKLSCWW